MKSFAVDILLWCLASPILFLKWLVRTAKRIRFWRTAYTPHIPCRSCGARISLVGMWRCGCGYTYKGHLLRHCPLCHSLPRVVRCMDCGISHLLPEEI